MNTFRYRILTSPSMQNDFFEILEQCRSIQFYVRIHLAV